MQLELILATPKTPKPSITLADILYGNICKITGSGRLVMRVKPTGFLLNSNIIADVINRGDCFVTAVEKGTMYSMSGTTPVSRVIAKMLYSTDIIEEA